MGGVILDFALIGILVIGITALIGVITSSIGLRFFSKGTADHHLNHSLQTQTGWNQVGGQSKQKSKQR